MKSNSACLDFHLTSTINCRDLDGKPARACRRIHSLAFAARRMSNSVDGKTLRNRAKVTELPNDATKGGFSEDSDQISRNEPPVTEVGQESFGAPPDNEVQFVKGYPIIRSGKFLYIPSLSRLYLRINPGADVSKYIVSTRDDGDPALTFRSIVLGTVFTALSSVITMLYVFKPYQVQVSATFLQRKHPC